ncbi:hypothetical protein [Myxacorys almedinensis]|uniref:Uncharacterized protein n=1 Tax=Myxacorys almedinensis A TaxID=2690445 RepID=A0A8J7Z4B9_9CYAN|nr:hypothetical protein [Myxacorys almedinensis]NDJ17873.1 hypothetical protein [Myxacorys almedinensis A]
MSKGNQKRTVLAPQQVVSSSHLPANCIISVNLDDDEDVQWTWTFLPSGERYVSGYTIVKQAGSVHQNTSV